MTFTTRSDRPRPRALAAASALLATLVLRPAVARADPFGEALVQKFGSDKANAANLKELYDRKVRGEVSAGVWFANLSGGISALSNAFGDIGSDGTPVDQATRSIGRGRGLVREIKLGLAVAGNEAFFDYLSDELFETAQEEVTKRVDNPVARRVIRQLMGELRPDLRSLLGPRAQVWVRGEYGKLQGSIDDAHVFASRNGKPYFGGRSEGWSTTYFGFEVGFSPTEAEPVDRQDKASFLALVGPYLRYRNFSRPMALGFAAESQSARFFLQDARVTVVELGLRAQLARCGTLCIELDGAMAPFTGYMNVNLDRLGDLHGSLLTVGAYPRLSYPIKLWGDHFIAPYAGFRTELIFPLVGLFKSGDLDVSDTTFRERPTVWPFDYFFWGPTLGITGRI